MESRFSFLCVTALTVLTSQIVTADLSVLHVGANTSFQSQILDLAEQIMLVDADVICMQQVLNEDEVHVIYDTLQHRYPYFYTCIEPQTNSPLLVVSKYLPENVQFHPFSTNVTEQGGFFEFILKDQATELGHIYTAHLSPDAASVGLSQIREKMEADFTTSEQSLPFLLCTNLDPLEGISYQITDLEYTINTTSVLLADNCLGVRTVATENNLYSLEFLLNNIRRMYGDQNYTILCGGRTELSGRTDTDGNSSVEARVSTSSQTDSGGKISAEFSGGVYKDNEGHTKSGVEVRGVYEW